MSSRSLNKVQLIGNLTRDPELRSTPQGTPVCTMGIATNRSWVDSSGQRQEETEFCRVVAWSKLAELCKQLLFKGRKVYVEGRLQTRRWKSQDGVDRMTTEVVIDDMIVLDNRRHDEVGGDDVAVPQDATNSVDAMSMVDAVAVDDENVPVPSDEELVSGTKANLNADDIKL